jgi:hypothetical protein
MMEGAQVAAHFVGADAGHDRGEARQIAERQVVGGQVREGNAELPDRDIDVVAGAVDISDRRPGRDRDVESQHPRLRGTHEPALLDVLVRDDLLSGGKFPARRVHEHRAHGGRAG